MIIAVDGPAASGKGTIARALARRFNLPHLDTGLLYRAVALNLLQMDGDPESEFSAARACDIAQIDFADPALKAEAVGGIASRISAFPMVREHLLERQRAFAAQAGGAVLDGRDIGTVVCPLADVKLFVTAAAEERARRRHLEFVARDEPASFAAILDDIRRRDERDSSRSTAPLKVADDAVVLDTTRLDAEAAFRRALDLVEEARGRG